MEPFLLQYFGGLEHLSQINPFAKYDEATKDIARTVAITIETASDVEHSAITPVS